MPDRYYDANPESKSHAETGRKNPEKTMRNYRIGMNLNLQKERELTASQMEEEETTREGSGRRNVDGGVFLPESPDTPSFGPPPGENLPPASGEADPASPGEGPVPLPTPSVPGGTWMPIFPGNTGDGSWPPIAIYPIPIVPGTGTTLPQTYCTIRFLHAVTGQGPVNISIGERPVVNQLQYGEISSYLIETSGLKRIRITDPRTRPILAEQVFWFNEGDIYTIALVNGMDGIEMFPIPDVRCRNQRRNAACVRAINLSFNAPAADVILQPAGINFRDLRFKVVPPYRQVLEGEQEFYVSETISGAAIFQMGEWMEAGRMYTLYLIGDAYGEPEISGVFTEDASGLEGYL